MMTRLLTSVESFAVQGDQCSWSCYTGTKISARAKDNLKLAIYYVKHQDRVLQTVNIGDITLTNVCKLIKQRDTEKNHTGPDTTPAIDSKDWPKTMEAVEEYLRQFRGVNDVPLRELLLPPSLL